VAERSATRLGGRVGLPPTRIVATRRGVVWARQMLASWLVEGQVRRLSAPTLREREQTLTRFFWFLEREDADVSRDTIRRFFAYLHRPLLPGERRFDSDHHSAVRPIQPNTSLAYFRVLSAWCAYLAEEGLIEAHPMKGMEAPRVPQKEARTLSEEDLASVFKAARSSSYPERDTALLSLMLATGLREGEICRLRVRDVDLSEQVVRVVGKGGKERLVGFGARCRRALARYVSSSTDMSEPLFMSQKSADGFLTPSGVIQLFERLEALAGLEKGLLRPHAMRRTFATLTIKAGVLSDMTLQRAMGHSDIRTTRRYCDMARADVPAKMRSDCPLDRLGKK
jgi:site-specific recombinase XerD